MLQFQALVYVLRICTESSCLQIANDLSDKSTYKDNNEIAQYQGLTNCT